MRVSSSADLVMWLPLVDGIERMGVLRLTAPAVDATRSGRFTRRA